MFIIVKMNHKTEQMMKYFPIDNQHEFENASTTISYLPNNNKNNILWQTNSKTTIPQYLRQDVSLLYENGLFKGIQQKWQQDVAKITLEKSFNIKNPSLLMAISFHHAEIHHEDETISSIQQMTSDQLYYNGKSTIFNQPKTKSETEFANKINEKNNQYLTTVWDNWMSYFQINKEDYRPIPLTDLVVYQDKNLKHFSMSQTEKIIGQLWEGLYENYITLLIDGQEKNHHPMPTILLANDDSHLIVLYEINDEKMRLIQNISK